MDFNLEFNEALKSKNIDHIKDFLDNKLEEAINNRDTALILQVLNEMIGFYRDICEFNISVKYAESLLNLISRLELDSLSLMICYINIANAYRANSDINNSEEM